MMADKGPNYTVERRRLEIQKLEHAQLIKRQDGRVEEIESQKAMNIARAELANMELDAESENLKANQKALASKIADIDKNLGLMVS